MIFEDRLPPQDIEAEESLLSAILFDGSIFESVSEILDADCFYKKSHQIIFETCQTLFKTKCPIDILSVKNALCDRLYDVGGIKYLVRFVDQIPVATNPEYTAKIIYNKYLLRNMIVKCADAVKACYENQTDAIDCIDKIQTDVLGIEKRDNYNFIHISDLICESMDRYERNYERQKQGNLPGIRLGFSDFDRLVGGFSGPEFIVIAGRPRMGKTAFMLSLIKNQCEYGFKVGCISLEMPREQLDDRLCAMVSGINTMRLSLGYGPKDGEWEHITKAASKRSTWNLLIDDSGAMHIDKLKRIIKNMVKQGCQIIYIDQLSWIRGDSDRFTNASNAVNELAMLKKDIGVPIVLLAQLNRDLEKRSTKEPQLSDLKNTGSLEEDSDKIFFIHRPGEYDSNVSKSDCIINLAKNRQGAMWRSTNIEFLENITLFRDKQ